MESAKITLKEAKAQCVWEIFRQVSAIPRCSGNEQRIIEWLKSFAAKRKLACRSDTVGNTVIELSATKGYEKAPAVVLQSHVDMVCEKTPESKHDFSKDPIELVERDGWVCADGTTLGADNGIGVSLALALPALERRCRGSEVEGLAHPKLELLFTVDEEIGLVGANALQPGFITGKYLINLDGEDKSLIVGCAGGENAQITLVLRRENIPAGLECFRLEVSGLFGGHSGVDIDKKRANAIKVLTRILEGLQDFNALICSIDGGKASNAIPRDASAIICLAPSKIDTARKVITDLELSFKKEFAKTDPNIRVDLKTPKEVAREKIINNQSSIINLLLAIPTGVYRMSDEFPGTVETSNNLASIETVNGGAILRITTMQRSFNMSAMDELTGKIADAAESAGAEIKRSQRYPAWKPDTDSLLLRRAKAVFRRLNHKEPEFKVVHAGLEPAVICEKFPGIEMISLGPTIENPHSPGERVEIASVDNAWKFLYELIASLK